MSDSRPNILLLMTDQQRGDCLGIEGHPVLETPYLDHVAATGVRFRHAYSAHPQCVPARRTLMTGQSARRHGVFANYDSRLDGPTLPGELTRAGYHTHLCGKLHMWPQRALYGFMSADWSDAPHDDHTGDYGTWLREQGIHIPHAGMAHGANANGWVARPFHLEERFHFTNWVTDCALRFLERRDPTRPFFLKVSYHQPHEPCTPPQCYWDRYIDADLPEPVVADWSRVQQEHQPGLPVDAWRLVLKPDQMRRFRAGYFGCINHIDDQIARILRHVPKNTIICFVSDHGEMLGDHQWMRKTRAFEGSARIPFLLRLTPDFGVAPGQVRDEPVELMDVMPTLLDCAGAPIPDGVEGASLLPRLRDASSPWRARIHGEMPWCGGAATGMQYLTDGRRKYIWEPGAGRELFFDLERDPQELRELSADPARQDEIDDWRQDLARRLEGRSEGFVRDGRLCRIDGRTAVCLPEFQRA